MKISLSVIVLFWAATLSAWCAQQTTPKQVVATEPGVQEFERVVSLGAVLATCQATSAELDELQKLSDEGLKATRTEAAAHPDSAAAQYMLGSWLLYGYRVIKVQQISIDEEGKEQSETVRKAVLGMSDNSDEGLAALKRATELAPDNGRYAVDYGAALFDYDRELEATGILKIAWSGKPELNPSEKLRVGLLLSDISANQGRYIDAREWIYAALLAVDSDNTAAVERLRHIDAAQAAEVLAASSSQPAPATEVGEEPSSTESSEEFEQAEPTAPGEVEPETEEGGEEEVAPSESEEKSLEEMLAPEEEEAPSGPAEEPSWEEGESY